MSWTASPAPAALALLHTPGAVGAELYKVSFHINELALTRGGGLRLASSERVGVS